MLEGGMKTIMSLAAAAIVTAGLAAPAMAQSTLRIGLAEDPDILDPTLARTYVGRLVFASLCDKLFDIDESLKIVPQLATGYEWADENKSLIIKLRQGVTFHDGEKFDAAAVKFNLERHKTMQGSTRRGELSSVASIDVVDPATVKLNLSAPFAPLLAILTDRSGMMVSPKASEALAATFGTKPVCSGPYKFVERVAQDRIVVEKYDGYWNKGTISIDRIVYRPIYDNTVRLANLQSGDLDFIERLAATDAPEVRKNSRLKLETVTELGYQGITINTNNTDKAKNPLGMDARVRQAFSLSIDREAINQVVFNGEYVPGNQWVSPNNPYYAKNVPLPKRDIAKAKALLKEAGQPNPSFTLMTTTAPDLQQVGQVIQAMAKEAGFDVKIQATEFASALKLSEGGNMEAFLLAWSGRPDPDANLHQFVTCKGPLNDGKFCNPKVDEGIEKARAVGDAAERGKLYAEVAGMLEKELPIVYLYHRKLFFAHSTKVSGFKVMPDGMIRVQGLKLGS
jgi:peptide/nickel transport system substrate-binding protein